MKIISIAILALIPLGSTTLAVLGFVPAAIMFSVSLLVVLAVLNISADRLDELALGPLRAKLNQKIAQVTQLSDELKRAIKLILTVAVSAGMRTGRFAHRTAELHRQIVSSVDSIVSETGLADSDRMEILADFYFYTDVDYRASLVGHTIFSEEERDVLRKHIQDKKSSSNDVISAARKLCELENSKSKEVEEWISDYEFFSKERKLRRPEIWWQNRDAYREYGIIRHLKKGLPIEKDD